MRTIRIALLLVTTLAVLLSACATPTQQTAQPKQEPTKEVVSPTTVPPTATVPPAAAKPKVAVLIFTQEFDSLSPLYSNMFFSVVTHQLWNVWAWEFDENNQPYPVLLKEMPSQENGGLSADGKVIILKLRDDIAWSDGEPITADDFIFTYEMYVSDKNTVSTTYPYDQLASIEAPDPHTVVMTFNQPFAPWLFFWHGMLPAHVLRPVFEKEGTLDTADWNKKPTVGSGPFVFAEWETGSYAKFVANDKYWLGRPKLDQIFIRFVPDDASQIASLKAGEADMGLFIAYPDIPTLEEAGVQIVQVASGFNEGIYMLLTDKAHPALKDLRVRQAIAYATDRFSLTQNLLLDKTVPAATFWDRSPYADPNVKPYPFDPEKAKQMLDEAGWKDSNGDGTRDKDGVELVLTYGTTTKEVRQDTQAVLQQQLADVGIKVELSNFEGDLFFGSYGDGGPAATGELDLMEWSDVPSAFPDPDIAYWICSEIPSDESPQGTNWQGICDPELDKLFHLQTTQVDINARIATFQQISKIMFDQVYWLGLWQDPDQYAINKRLLNVKLSGGTPFSNVMEWDIQP